MKGLIAEIDGRNMIVITEKGDFVKVKRNIKYGIGDEIQLPVRSQKQLYRMLSAVAASILICVMLSSGVYAYYTPYSYVSVDINPSLGLSLNRFEKVIDVQPLNEDARKLISTAAPIKYEDIDVAMSEILQSAAKNGYLKPDQENGVMVVVSTKEKDEEDKLAKEIKTVSQKELSKVSKKYNVMLEKTSVNEYKAAIAQKTSPGKVKLAERVKKADPTIKEAQAGDMTVKQAMQIINEKRKAEHEADKAEKDEIRKGQKLRRAFAGDGKGSDGVKAGAPRNGKGPANSHGRGQGKVKAAGSKDSNDKSKVQGKGSDRGNSKGSGDGKSKGKKKDDVNNNGDQGKGNAPVNQDSKGIKDDRGGQDKGNGPDKQNNKGEHDNQNGGKDSGKDKSGGDKRK